MLQEPAVTGGTALTYVVSTPSPAALALLADTPVRQIIRVRPSQPLPSRHLAHTIRTVAVYQSRDTQSGGAHTTRTVAVYQSRIRSQAVPTPPDSRRLPVPGYAARR